jgi:hypothetical protein
MFFVVYCINNGAREYLATIYPLTGEGVTYDGFSGNWNDVVDFVSSRSDFPLTYEVISRNFPSETNPIKTISLPFSHSVITNPSKD